MSAYVSRMTRIPLNKIIRISERTIRPENEFKVKEIMTGVEKQVKKWPGLMSVETLVDTEQPHKYVVITEVSALFPLATSVSPSCFCLSGKIKLQ